MLSEFYTFFISDLSDVGDQIDNEAALNRHIQVNSLKLLTCLYYLREHMISMRVYVPL